MSSLRPLPIAFTLLPGLFRTRCPQSEKWLYSSGRWGGGEWWGFPRWTSLYNYICLNWHVEREWIAKGTKRVGFLWDPLRTRMIYISRVGSHSGVINLWRRAVEVRWSVFTVFAPVLAIAKLLNFGQKFWLQKCFTENIEAIWTSSLKIRAKIEICMHVCPKCVSVWFSTVENLLFFPEI